MACSTIPRFGVRRNHARLEKIGSGCIRADRPTLCFRNVCFQIEKSKTGPAAHPSTVLPANVKNSYSIAVFAGSTRSRGRSPSLLRRARLPLQPRQSVLRFCSLIEMPASPIGMLSGTGNGPGIGLVGYSTTLTSDARLILRDMTKPMSGLLRTVFFGNDKRRRCSWS